MRVLAVVACGMALAVAGCTAGFGGGAFECQTSDQCTNGGTCQPIGFCSFDDSNCASGQRYSDASGDLSGVCVGDEPAPDAFVPLPDADPNAPDADPNAPDAMPTPDADPAAPDAMPPDILCPNNPDLIACFAFEGNVTDGSSNGNTPSSTGAAYAAGVDGMALQTSAASTIVIAENNTLNLTNMTIEAFINAAIPSSGNRAGIVDNQVQYGFFLRPNGNLSCTAGGASIQTTSNAISANTWTHVACTYDGSTTRIYVDGLLDDMMGGGGAMSAGGTDGLSIGRDNPPQNGDPLTGRIDNMRLWNVARSQSQICAAASCL